MEAQLQSILEHAAGIGWAGAVTVVAVLAYLVAYRVRKLGEKSEKELNDAVQNLVDAVNSGDPDRIHLANVRLRDARKRAGLS